MSVIDNPLEAVNPKRRAKRALGRSGRQWVKYRKAQARRKLTMQISTKART